MPAVRESRSRSRSRSSSVSLSHTSFQIQVQGLSRSRAESHCLSEADYDLSSSASESFQELSMSSSTSSDESEPVIEYIQPLECIGCSTDDIEGRYHLSSFNTHWSYLSESDDSGEGGSNDLEMLELLKRYELRHK